MVSLNVPHTRGDEPDRLLGFATGKYMFPTPVGMNRGDILVTSEIIYVPHTRGDEPKYIFSLWDIQ